MITQSKPMGLIVTIFFFLINLLITVNEENIVTISPMGRVPFIQGSSTAETPEAKFEMLSTQIKDHLFPKVAAETTLVQSKRFYKTEKIHYKNTQRGEVD